jgi:hypothetical protein
MQMPIRYLHLSYIRIYTIHCKTTGKPGVQTLGQTNPSILITPLQYNIEVKNVVISEA